MSGLVFISRAFLSATSTIVDDAETLARHHGAKVVVRIKCEIFPNCPRYVPDLMGASADPPANPFVPRPGYEPPAPERKSRDYLKDVLSKYDPHRKRDA